MEKPLVLIIEKWRLKAAFKDIFLDSAGNVINGEIYKNTLCIWCTWLSRWAFKAWKDHGSGIISIEQLIDQQSTSRKMDLSYHTTRQIGLIIEKPF